MRAFVGFLFAACCAFAQPSATSVYVDLSGPWTTAEPGSLVLPIASTLALPTELPFQLERSIVLPNTELGGLAILMTPLGRAYVIQINGRRIGSHGSPDSWLSPSLDPMVFRIPDGVLRPGENRIRIEVAGARLLPHRQLGLPLGGALLAPEAQLQSLAEGRTRTRQLRLVYLIFNCGLQLVFAAILWAMSEGNRYRFSLRLMAMFFLQQVVIFDALLAGIYFTGLSPTLLALLLPVYTLLSTALLMETGLALAGIPLPWALRFGYYLFVAVSAGIGGFFSAPKLWVVVLVDALVLWKAMDRQRPIAIQYLVLLLGYDLVQAGLLPPIELPPLLTVGPLAMHIVPGYRIVIGLVLILIAARQSAKDRSERERLAGELESARTIQQFLLPRTLIAGVDAFYQPAAEVGGDFYHAVDLAQGSRLIVLGDVSGKGLRAALLASVAVGALGATKNVSPALLLAELNQLLCERATGGFVTCCCLRVDAGGEVTIANAGHLPPYLDLQEVETAPGLPLGIVPGAEYEETHVLMGTSSQLTVISDGVVEAAKANGELFGFERTRAASGGSANEIGTAAQAWGQTDDITVVTVRRPA